MVVGYVGALDSTWVNSGERMGPTKEGVTMELGKPVIMEATTAVVKRGVAIRQWRKPKLQIARHYPELKVTKIMQQRQW